MKNLIKKVERIEKEIREEIKKENKKQLERLREKISKLKEDQTSTMTYTVDMKKIELAKYWEKGIANNFIINMKTGNIDTYQKKGEMEPRYIKIETQRDRIENKLEINEEKLSFRYQGYELPLILIDTKEPEKTKIKETQYDEFKELIKRAKSRIEEQYASNSDWYLTENVRLIASVVPHKMNEVLLEKFKNKQIGKRVSVSEEDRRYRLNGMTQLVDITVLDSGKIIDRLKKKSELSKKLTELAKEAICAE